MTDLPPAAPAAGGDRPDDSGPPALPQSLTSSIPHSLPGLRWLACVLAIHIALALVFTWPLSRDFDSRVPGPDRTAPRPAGDALQYLWNVWWVHRAVLTGQNPYECPDLFHPLGGRLYFDTLTVWNGLVALPFVGELGPTRAANIMILVNLVLCGLFATGLGWEATRSRTGAFFTGLAFGLAPVVFGRLADGQWNFSTTAPLALCAWLLLRLAHRPTVARSIALGFGLGAAGYAEYTYLLFLLFLTGFMAVAAMLGLGPGGSRRWRFIGCLLLAGAILIGLMAPVLLGARREYQLGGEQSVHRRGLRDYSADVAEYLIPNPAHPLLRDWSALQDWMSKSSLGGESRRAAPGFAVLGLAALALIWRSRGSRGEVVWWALMAAIAILISFGGIIRFLGDAVSPGVYRYFKHVPVLGFVRAPGRYSALAQLALSVLAGYGAAELARRRWRVGVGVAIAALLFEFLPAPIPLTNVETVPSPVVALAAERDPGAVWDIGVYPREGLLYQTVHGLPTVGGYYSRIWDLDGIPQWSLERVTNEARTEGAGAEELLQDVLEAWQIRAILVSPTAPAALAGYLDQRRWLLAHQRDQGWSLYRVLARPEGSLAGLDARLLSRLDDPRPGIESAVFLALHERDRSGPQLQWNATPEQIEAQRAWWRDWGRKRGLSVPAPAARNTNPREEVPADEGERRVER